MIVLLTGPEKVGKTTLANEVLRKSREMGVHAVYATLRRPDPLDPDAYLELLKLGCRTDTLVVMDRGWPDEMVYSKLLDRPSPIKSEAWAEWCLGAVMRTVGWGYALVPAKRREELDRTDIQLPYDLERREFTRYGHQWGYDVVTEWTPWHLANHIMLSVQAAQQVMLTWPELMPPEYVGPPVPGILLVGERRNDKTRDPMAWSAMTSRFFQPLAEVLPISVARTNADQLEEQGVADIAMGVPTIIALGNVARDAVQSLGRGDAGALQHPSYVLRWSKDQGDYVNQLSRLVNGED